MAEPWSDGTLWSDGTGWVALGMVGVFVTDATGSANELPPGALSVGSTPVREIYFGALKLWPPASVPARILVLTMNQASGSMLDGDLSNHGVVSGGVERRLPGITTGSSFSCALDGLQGTHIVVSHIPRYQTREDGTAVIDFTAVTNFQLDTAPASQMVIAAKDATGMPGGWTIEAFTSGGVTRLRGYIRNAAGTAVWIGSSTGVATLAIGTAYRAALTYAAGVAALWLDDGAAKATQAIAGPGMSANTADLWIGAYNGGGAATDGVFDEFLMWDHARSQAEIEALDDAVTIDHGGTPPPPPPDGPSVTTHKNLGTTNAQQLLEGPPNARYDFTGTDLVSTYNAANNSYSPSFNIRAFEPIDSAEVFGATIRNGYATSLGDGASRKYPANHGGQFLLRDADYTGLTIRHCRFDHNWDPIRFENISGVSGSAVRVLRCAFTRTFDDNIENDKHWPGMSAEHCLAECFVFWSDRNSSGDGSANTSLIESCLVWMRPSYSGQSHWPGTFQVFKLNSRSTRFDIRNSVFRIDKETFGTGSEKDPFDNLKRFNKIANSQNNRILWTQSGAYPWTVPDGFTLVTGSAALTEWNARRAQWWADNPQVPRIAGDPPATPSETLLFTSDEANQTVGSSGAGICPTATWGPATDNFNAGNFSIQNDPAGGGGKCYRLTYTASDTSSIICRRFVDVYNSGNDLIDIGIESEIYIPGPSPTIAGEDLKMVGIVGHDVNHLSQRIVNNDPSVRLNAFFQSGIKDEASAYSYYVNNTTPNNFGEHVNTDVQIPVNTWTKVRADIRGGSGDFTGTIKVYVNGILRAERSGIKWHTTPGFGWRHVMLVTHSQQLSATYNTYLRNVKVYRLT